MHRSVEFAVYAAAMYTKPDFVNDANITQAASDMKRGITQEDAAKKTANKTKRITIRHS